jgi:hypothetical protein
LLLFFKKEDLPYLDFPDPISAGGRGLAAARGMQEVRPSFLKKRSKKLLFLCVRFRRLRDSTCKSLLLLFFRKEESFLTYIFLFWFAQARL